MQQKKQRKTGPWIAGIITALLAGLIYWLIFPLEKAQHFILCGCISLGLGWLILVMAQGVDTSKAAPAQKKIKKTGDAAADALIEKGQELLFHIRRENALIPDPALSHQMERLEEVTNKIFHTVADRPSAAPQIRRAMDYYLPTALKMLQGFRKMDERGITGESALSARQQIHSGMDIIIRAFEKQLDHLYQNEILDISTDIDVLEAMLKQDGLREGGLQENNE
ncbi:MAG: 5-bromo-4-chloroindolyl phosphate hydrolysis family protein [Clostridia bacterium]|nr:5-bromo-4-chloroindolyl phosphate hydrolysis family protein [Clostridia bacterium]